MATKPKVERTVTCELLERPLTPVQLKAWQAFWRKILTNRNEEAGKTR
jgi:hypothetical protein